MGERVIDGRGQAKPGQIQRGGLGPRWVLLEVLHGERVWFSSLASFRKGGDLTGEDLAFRIPSGVLTA